MNKSTKGCVNCGAEKDARIAEAVADASYYAARNEELRSHIRTDNTEALANALKEIERLKTISDNYCALLMDANQKLQAAPAERGVVLPEPMQRGDEGGSGEYGAAMIRGFNACLRAVKRMNPAPVTADSDVREVK